MNNFLINPFVRIAGLQSLMIGAATILVTAFIASFGNIHLDGVLDLHVGGSGSSVGMGLALIEGLINLGSITLFVYLAGLIFSKSSIRFVDVMGTQSMARFPYLIACIGSLFLSDEKILSYVEYEFMHKGDPVQLVVWDYISFILAAIIFMGMFVWSLVLMYKAYSVSCNVKGGKSVVTFIVALLLAETLSKILLNTLIY